jgi:hypothetical protein
MENNEAAYAAAEPLLLQVAAEFLPDLLHTNQFCFGRLPLPVPRLITAHSDVLSWAAACRPGGLEASPWLENYRDLVQQGLRAADAVIAPTHWMLDALGRNFSLPDCNGVILNGRSLPAPEPAASSQRKLQAVSVGRFWDEAKGLAVLAGLNSPLPILIAGEKKLIGADTAEQSSATAKDGPDGTSAIQALGFVNEPELLNLFASSSVYIAAAIYEPFGLAPLEAALCGCAIVANDIPSLREVWADAALYFSGRTELESLLQQLESNPTVLAAAQARSHTRAKQFTAERMTAEYLSLYQSLLCKRDQLAQAPTAASHRTQTGEQALNAAPKNVAPGGRKSRIALPAGGELLTHAW